MVKYFQILYTFLYYIFWKVVKSSTSGKTIIYSQNSYMVNIFTPSIYDTVRLNIIKITTNQDTL